MTRSSARLLGAFMGLVCAIAAVQLVVFHHSQPAPDSIEYFEVADQIERVGYAKAVSLHWSPLYPLYLLAARRVTSLPIERELAVTAAADVVLLVGLCVVVGLVFSSLGRLCFPEDEEAGRAWLAYAGGLALYFAFGVLRVGLRMPDALVTSLTVLTVWAWCRAMARGLDLRWSALAGLLGGVAYLTRSNLMHWSLVAAAAACAIAPQVGRGRRLAAYAVFAAGLFAFVGPQVWVLSSTRGYVTTGESGKIVFAETYGAVWPGGHSAWPVRTSDGDVRIFTETRNLNFPGFYDPGREYDDATIPFRLTKTFLTIARSMRATLFGYWSPAFALMWPLFWALWPVMAYGFSVPAAAGGGPPATASHVLRRRLSWFLIAAGGAGVGMHLFSFSIGYYLPPYLIPLLLGLYLGLLDRCPPEPAARRQRHRAAIIVAAVFAAATMLTTANYLRRADSRGRAEAVADTHAMAAALASLPAGDGGKRRLAVAGNWLGLYAVRLSDCQVFADIPDPDVLHDRERGAAVIRALREQGVVAILMPRSEARQGDLLTWNVVSSAWTLADLRQWPLPGAHR